MCVFVLFLIVYSLCWLCCWTVLRLHGQKYSDFIHCTPGVIFKFKEGTDHFTSKCRLNSGGVLHQKQGMNNNKQTVSFCTSGKYHGMLFPCFVPALPSRHNWLRNQPQPPFKVAIFKISSWLISYLKENLPDCDLFRHHHTVPYIFISRSAFYLVCRVSLVCPHNIQSKITYNKLGLGGNSLW